MTMNQATIDRAVAASLKAGDDELCERVPRVLVDPAELNAAERMLDLMTYELRLPKDMLVGWFKTYTGPVYGLTPERTFDHVAATTTGRYRFKRDPYMVWVRAGIGPREAAATIAHECRHAYQYLRLGGMDDDPEQRERDAYEYEFKLIQSFQQ